MKKFWKKTEGFTLVELIVVIAILGILAGVGTVGYSGYVKKANVAADEALLAELNAAFAAACLTNGQSHIGRTDVEPITLVNKKIPDTYVFVSEAIDNSFDSFYEGKEFEFKVFSSIVYFPDLGGFRGSEGAPYEEVTINGKTYRASRADIDAYLNSTLGKTMTSGEITDIAVSTAGVVFELYEGTYVTDLLTSGSYSDAVKELFGMDYKSYADEQFEIWATEKGYNLSNSRDKSKAKSEWESTKKSQFDQNLMILASVSQANKAGDTILSDLKSPNAKQTIINNLTKAGGATGEQAALGLSQAALAYGLYVSYAGKDATVLNFTSELGNPTSGFSAYLNGPQAETDLAGVLSAMNVISEQDKASLDSAVVNGIDRDEDLASALQQILGK